VSALCFEDVVVATGARLLRGDPGRRVCGVSTDTRSIKRDQIFFALAGPNHDGNRYAEAAVACGAAGLLLREDASAPEGDVAVALVPDPRRALADLARWYRGRLHAEVIGITGSCGKTTTKDMLAELLRGHRRTVASPASFNNDIGVPHSLLLASDDTEALVLEIGTNAPGEIASLCAIARPTAGVLTGIGASHLAGLGSIEGVAEEKAALIDAVPADGFVVLNAGCRFTPRIAERASARVITFGLDGAGDLTATDLSFHPWGTAFLLNGRTEVRLPLLGQHMVQNLLAALAACQGHGLALEDVLPAVPRLVDGAGRLQRREVGGLLVLDDTYNANPESVRASVRVLAALRGHAQRVFVLGDMQELGERSAELHTAVGEDVAAAGIDRLVTVGAWTRAASMPPRTWTPHSRRSRATCPTGTCC
jgi:UDP-N-acetylmuramoyl-tripeptide--D-alanyl-D-alanine ligase